VQCWVEVEEHPLNTVLAVVVLILFAAFCIWLNGI